MKPQRTFSNILGIAILLAMLIALLVIQPFAHAQQRTQLMFIENVRICNP